MRRAPADFKKKVFDTLTLADDRLEAFYDNPNALRDYFRDIGRMVLAAEGRKANDSHDDCYQYFCVPEYGTANGRLHFDAVHFIFFQAEDGIRDYKVTGVQTCALPICPLAPRGANASVARSRRSRAARCAYASMRASTRSPASGTT